MTLTLKNFKAMENVYGTVFYKCLTSNLFLFLFVFIFTSENRHVSPRGTIRCVFFQNLKGMVSRLCVQQVTLINGTHAVCHCGPNCNLHW